MSYCKMRMITQTSILKLNPCSSWYPCHRRVDCGCNAECGSATLVTAYLRQVLICYIASRRTCVFGDGELRSKKVTTPAVSNALPRGRTLH